MVRYGKSVWLSFRVIHATLKLYRGELCSWECKWSKNQNLPLESYYQVIRTWEIVHNLEHIVWLWSYQNWEFNLHSDAISRKNGTWLKFLITSDELKSLYKKVQPVKILALHWYFGPRVIVYGVRLSGIISWT